MREARQLWIRCRRLRQCKTASACSEMSSVWCGCFGWVTGLVVLMAAAPWSERRAFGKETREEN